MPILPRTRIMCYGVALAGMGLAAGARLLLDPVLGGQFRFATLFFAVLLAAWYGGFGPALAATALGAVLSAAFLLPRDRLAVAGFENPAGLIVYLLISSAIALVGGAMHHARRRAEAHARDALHRSEQLRIALGNIRDAVAVTDAAGRVVMLNPEAESLTGWQTGEAAGQPLEAVFRAIDEETGRKVEDPVSKALRDGVAVGSANHTVLISRDGGECLVEDKAAPVRDAAGAVTGVILTFRDITDRRRGERELKEQRQRLRVMLASIGDAVIATDVKSRVTLMNPVAEALTGWTDTAARGRPLEDVFHIIDEQSHQPVESPAVEALRRGTSVRAAEPTVLVAQDGAGRIISTTSAPILDEDGTILGVILTFRDVTERRRADQERRHLAAIVESSDDAIYSQNLQGVCTSWNAGAERLYGYSAAEMVGKSVSILVPPEKVAERSDIMDRLKRGEATEQVETTRRRKDGTPVEVSVTTSPVRDAAGRIVGASSISRDISRQKQAAEAIRHLNRNLHRRIAEFQTLLDVIPIGIAIAEDPECRRVWTNPVLARLLELGPDANASLIAPPGERPAFRIFQGDRELAVEERPLHVVTSTGREVRDLELDFVLADGRRRKFLSYAGPLFDENGKVRGGIFAGVEITERVRVLEQLRDSEERLRRKADDLRLLADASAALAGLVDYQSALRTVARLAVPHFADWCTVDMVDPDGKLRRLAAAHRDPAKVELAHEMHRRWPAAPDAPSETGVVRILRTGQAELVSGIPDEALAQSVTDPELLRLYKELGLESYMRVLLAVRGQPLGVITFVAGESGRRYDAADLAVAQDLANRAATAVDNARLYGELREADRRKDEFLAILAHELRNPLAPIRTSLHILRLADADPAAHEQARDVIERQVQQLVRLVDDLLDVSRIMRGKIELRKERIELATVVARAAETAQPLLDAQKHRLTVSLPEGPVPLEADPVRLAQVLGNLLTNAAKYTERGGRIWLTACILDAEPGPIGRAVTALMASEPSGDGQAVASASAQSDAKCDGQNRPSKTVEIRVKDTGIGIPADMLSRIFDLFTQAHSGAGRSQGGLGIGLTLVRSLIEMHSGTVEARSDGPGRGSDLIVRLPLAGLPAASSDGAKTLNAGPAALPSRRRILVVDDNVDAARSLAVLLRLEGQDVAVAHDGPSALREADVRRPEIVVLDIGMPGMDGYEVAARLRQRPDGDQLLLIALTGWGQEADRRRSQEAGIDHHLVKPVEFAALYRLLALPGAECKGS